MRKGTRATRRPSGSALDLDRTLVRPLRLAENEFLQVLLTKFQMRREGGGVVLRVAFDRETPAISLGAAKAHVLSRMSGRSVAHYQAEFESMLVADERDELRHDDAGFPMRFGNGGTLPVIHIGSTDYFCLFYRDVPPVGWNVANGGADSLAELLDPVATIERELREELIIVEPSAMRRYAFAWDEGRPYDHPDHAPARRYWRDIFKKRNFRDLGRIELPLKWMSGDDAVEIAFEDDPVVRVQDVLLNVNAEDFGIEIDRVAKMSIGPDAVICDGEFVHGVPLDSVVGLFKVGRFDADDLPPEKEFAPDRMFLGGRERTGDELGEVVAQFFGSAMRRGVREDGALAEHEKLSRKFALCPVTRNLVRRHLRLERSKLRRDAARGGAAAATPGTDSRPHDVFLSFASEDRPLARVVHKALVKSGRSVFFSDETAHHPNFSVAIDEALDAAGALVVVGTREAHFAKPWVHYEWRTFHNDLLCRRKPEKTPLVTVVEGMDDVEIPRALGYRRVVRFDSRSPARALTELRSALGGPRSA